MSSLLSSLLSCNSNSPKRAISLDKWSSTVSNQVCYSIYVLCWVYRVLSEGPVPRLPAPRRMPFVDFFVLAIKELCDQHYCSTLMSTRRLFGLIYLISLRHLARSALITSIIVGPTVDVCQHMSFFFKIFQGHTARFT